MKNINQIAITILLLCLLAMVCRFVWYNILREGRRDTLQMYVFSIPEEKLIDCMNRQYANHVVDSVTSQDMYKRDACIIRQSQDTLVFGFEITGVQGNKSESMLIWTHAGKYGQVLERDWDINRDKRKE